jgi:hypothetical protein
MSFFRTEMRLQWLKAFFVGKPPGIEKFAASYQYRFLQIISQEKMTGSRHDYSLIRLLQEVSFVTNCFSSGSDSCQSHLECIKIEDNYFSRGHNEIMEGVCNNDINLSISNARVLPDSGLAGMDHEALREFVSPIFDCLSTINAEELLDLERVSSGGAHLGNG